MCLIRYVQSAMEQELNKKGSTSIMIDLTGQKFGRLTALRAVGRCGTAYLWECICLCGKIKNVSSNDLRKGHTKSCGCLLQETQIINGKLYGASAGRAKATHNQSRHKNKKASATYVSWDCMKNRCFNPNTEAYKYYGGRGITVCERWLGKNGLQNFLADMGERPADKTLDRIDVNGNYEPSNCRWATNAEQQLNKRRALSVNRAQEQN